MHAELGDGGGNIPGMCVTPDQLHVMVVLEDTPIRVYDTSSLEQSHEYGPIDEQYDCIVAPDGEAFYVSTSDGTIHRIDMDDLTEMASTDGSDESVGDVTGESGLVYTASDCFACPEEDWYVAAKAFDDVRGTSSDSWHTTWSGDPEWVAVDFGEGNEKAIRHYGIMGAAFSPSYSAKAWQLQASHDGTVWDSLHTVTDASLTYVMWGGEPFTEYSFTNETTYRHWRMYVTENMGGHELGIVELELMENLAD